MNKARIGTISVQSIHPGKPLVTPLTNTGAVTGVQLRVAPGVMLARKGLVTAGPLALEVALLVVRLHVA